ncbi:Long-chain-fatty-acid--CoA ligase 2 [Vanrija pseudolonga]|uniref:Long-chain-fatty-acid--CoA ligase 2 n=1 Tax=Vanrija pseudolonga TaxID=143232 RepID=A0AAF1BK50_9TREE|nr:Long-chain-fatty-acid--CoA ligase 2 [Vanrija pseudolonga]
MAPRKNNEPASWEVDADKPKPEGETRARRSYCVKDLTLRPENGIDTVHDVMLYAARTHGAKQALGGRDIIGTVEEEKEITKVVGGKEVKEKKKWSYFKLSPLDWISYDDALREVRELGSGLREHGIGGKEEQFFNIYAATSRNWMLMAQACAFNAVPICTAYDSLGPEGLKHSLNETAVPGMFTNSELLKTLVKVIADAPSVNLVVYDGKPNPEAVEAIEKTREGLKVVHIDDLRKAGQEQPHEALPASRDDVYCCMYTSGSTGTPKGVLLTHGNVTSAIGSVWKLLYEYLTPTDTYLAFLPLAHILEFVVEMSFIFAGLPIAYGRIKTLTDASVRECKSDIMEAKPSIMVGVPQVWELIRKGILTKVESSSSVKKGIFNFAVRAKTAAKQYSIPLLGGITDAVVFNQVRAQTGGRLKIMFNGGGAVSRSTQHFLQTALVMMIQGYGLTEGTAMACILNPGWLQLGSVGGPVPGAEIKLVDAPEAGYFSTNDPPQGEVYIRGPAIFKGYYKRPDLDDEAFTSDRWFKTGDIGQWNKDGTLSIIDRIKNLVKLQGGEYVALEHLESIYKSASFVANGAVLANPQHTKPAMIVMAHPVNLPAFAKKAGLTAAGEDLETMCKDPEVVDACLKELNAVGKKQGLKGMELLEALILTPDEWTPESGLLTAAQKLQRKVIERTYDEQIKAVYA